MNFSECDSLQNTQTPTPNHREILFWPKDAFIVIT